MELSHALAPHTTQTLDYRSRRPISLVLKPPAPKVREIERQRRFFEIPSDYGLERLHMTLLPIDDARYFSSLRMERLLRALASFKAEPFEVRLIRLKDNALRGARTRDLRLFQARLAALLTEAGFDLPHYRFRPHLSLAYGNWQERNAPISPISWQAEEFLLIKSIYGEGRHQLLGSWPLVSRQLSFGF